MATLRSPPQPATSDPGAYTSMAHIAADTLGLPMSRVRFLLGESQYPRAAAQYGSQTMASVGSNVALTANMLRDRLVAPPSSPGLAAERCSPGLHNCRRRTHASTRRTPPGRNLPTAPAPPWPRPPDATDTYTPDDANDHYSMHSYGTVCRSPHRRTAVHRADPADLGRLRRRTLHQPETRAQPRRRHGATEEP
jgi:xanthine dehydrogenase YagR molybdenum-binding subunit